MFPQSHQKARRPFNLMASRAICPKNKATFICVKERHCYKSNLNDERQKAQAKSFQRSFKFMATYMEVHDLYLDHHV